MSNRDLPILQSISSGETFSGYPVGDELCDCILTTTYGSEGLAPTASALQGACIGSSGDNLCGNYRGHQNITGTKLSIVFLC